MRVLIVDDDFVARRSVEEILAAEGHEIVAVAEDGTDGLSLAIEHKPDLVIMDLHMPGMSGKEVLYEIRANPDIMQTKVIISSADAALAQTLKDQADAILVKPVAPNSLQQLIIQLLNLEGA